MRRLSIAFVVAGLIAAACGQPPTGTTSPAPSAAASTTAAVTRGGTAIVAIWQFPSTLAAHYANQTVTDIVNNSVIDERAETNYGGDCYPTLAMSGPTFANDGAKL